MARETDLEGNTSLDSTALIILIDTQIQTLDMPDLVSSSDTGALETDNITRDNTPDIEVLCKDDDVDIELEIGEVLRLNEHCNNQGDKIAFNIEDSLEDG